MYSIIEFDEWQIFMRIHLSSLHEHMWQTITEGLQIPMIGNPAYPTVGVSYRIPEFIAKDKGDYYKEDFVLSNLDGVALYVISKTLGKSMFLKIKNN